MSATETDFLMIGIHMLGSDSILAIKHRSRGPYQFLRRCTTKCFLLQGGYYAMSSICVGDKMVAVRRRSPNVVAAVSSKPIPGELEYTADGPNKIERRMYLNLSTNYKIDMKSTQDNRFASLLTGAQKEELDATPIPRNVFMREHKPEGKKTVPSRWAATIPEDDEPKGGSRWESTLPEEENDEPKGGSRWGAMAAEIEEEANDDQRPSNTFMSSRHQHNRHDGRCSGPTLVRQGPTLDQFIDRKKLRLGPALGDSGFRLPPVEPRDRAPRKERSRFRRPDVVAEKPKRGPTFDLEKSMAAENFPTLGVDK